jgi:hypothetical protein
MRDEQGTRKQEDNPSSVSTRVGQHIAAIQTILIQAVRAVLLVYKTTPLPILFREAGIPSAEVALEEARWRLALRLQTIDRQHPLTHRAVIPHNQSGTRVGERQQPRTKIQRLTSLPVGRISRRAEPRTSFKHHRLDLIL